MRDFESYYAAGVTWNAGGDPYSREIWQAERTIPGVIATRDELLPFVGPAAFRPLWSLLARLPYVVAMRAWSVALGLALIVLVLGTLALANAERDPRTIAGAFLVSLGSGPIISDIALGQVALVAAAGVVAALIALRAGSWIGSIGAILASAVQPNVALVLIARMRDRSALVAAGSAFALFLASTFASGGGFAGLAAYVRLLSAHADAERVVTIQHTVTAIAYGFGLARETATQVGWSVSLLALAAAIALVWRVRLDPLAATVFACAVLPLIVPFFHEHDFAIELFPALFLAVRARGVAISLAAFGTLLALTDWLGLAQRANGQWQLIGFVFAVALAFVAVSGQARHRFTFVPGIAVAVLIVAIAPFAQAHLAPTWPDFLTERWHAPAGWTVAEVWHAEQVASGLEAREWAWSLLRAFPLLGCVLLGAALTLDERRRAALSA